MPKMAVMESVDSLYVRESTLETLTRQTLVCTENELGHCRNFGAVLIRTPILTLKTHNATKLNNAWRRCTRTGNCNSHVCAGRAKVHRFGNDLGLDGNAGFLSGPDINLYLGALASLNISKVCPQAGQTKLFASRGPNGTRSARKVRRTCRRPERSSSGIMRLA
jgi:hypothetical protein